MTTLKRLLPDIVAVVLFAVVAFAYFFPADTEGRILYRHDSSAGVGAGQEQAFPFAFSVLLVQNFPFCLFGCLKILHGIHLPFLHQAA